MSHVLPFRGHWAALLAVGFVFCSGAALAQTGIGTASPDASAALDVSAATRGLLTPRVALTAANAAAPLTLPATSLLVYNTNVAMPGGVGFYYNAGSPASPSWEKVVTTTSPAGGDQWKTAGNAGTTPGTQFIGTTDTQDVVFKAAGTERLRLKQNGALWQAMPNANTALGTNTGVALSTGGNNTLLGLNAGTALSTASNNTIIGSGAGAAQATSGNVTLVGTRAGAANTVGGNTFIGFEAGLANTTGSANTFVGPRAGTTNVTGANNSFLGTGAGLFNTASNNTFMGAFAGNANDTGGGNTFVGTQAGQTNSAGGQNTFVGTAAGSANTASANTFVGNGAGSGASTGGENVALGTSAGVNLGTGLGNTLLGDGADVTSGTLTNATAIGRGALVGQSNALILGNGADVGIGTNTPAKRLHVAGTAGTPNIRLGSLAGTATRVVTADANGDLSAATGISGLAWVPGGNSFGTEQRIGTNDAFDLPFETNNTERLRLRSCLG